MFPVVTAARNVARHGALVLFVFVFKFCFLTVSQGFRDRGSTAHYGLPRMLVRFLPTCHVLFGPTTFGHVPTTFCYVYQVLSRFSTEKGGRWVVFEPVCTHGIKEVHKAAAIIICCAFDQKTLLMPMKKPNSYLYKYLALAQQGGHQ